MEDKRDRSRMDKEYCLHIWGPLACFTRPEMKAERVSYDVITPSAARAIFQAIFWKPAIRWEITRIEVLSPIKWFTMKRNEVASTANFKNKGININDCHRQRASYLLRDVDYRIYARMVYIPVSERSAACRKYYAEEYTDAQRAAECPRKYQEIFERRAQSGQCFTVPYLGCREFLCSFEYVDPDSPILPEPIQESRDLGIMLFDMDYSESAKDPSAMFYRAHMEDGVIRVPSVDSSEILR